MLFQGSTSSLVDPQPFRRTTEHIKNEMSSLDVDGNRILWLSLAEQKIISLPKFQVRLFYFLFLSHSLIP